MSENDRIPILLCGGSQGRAIIFGWVDSKPVAGESITVYQARMIIRWTGSSGLFGLAANGPADGTRITESIESVTDQAWQQWLHVDKQAADRLAKWPSC